MLPPYTVHGTLPALVRWASCATLYCATPPLTAPRLDAACFGAMGVCVLGDAFLCYPPPPRLNYPCLSAMGTDVPPLCCTPYIEVRVSAAHFWLLLLQFVRALPVYPTVRLDAALMLRFWGMVPFLPLSSFYTASWRGCYHD